MWNAFTEISSRDLTKKKKKKKKTIKKRDLWFFLALFAKLLVQVLCAGARDTLFWCGVAGDRLHGLVTTELLVPYFYKIVRHNLYEVCLVDCASVKRRG